MNRNDAYQEWLDGNINFRSGALLREAFHAGWDAAVSELTDEEIDWGDLVQLAEKLRGKI
jgi:hypothetical protein